MRIVALVMLSCVLHSVVFVCMLCALHTHLLLIVVVVFLHLLKLLVGNFWKILHIFPLKILLLLLLLLLHALSLHCIDSAG